MVQRRLPRKYGEFPDDFLDESRALEIEDDGFWVGWAQIGTMKRLITCYDRSSLLEAIDGSVNDFGYFGRETVVVVAAVTVNNLTVALEALPRLFENVYSAPDDATSLRHGAAS